MHRVSDNSPIEKLKVNESIGMCGFFFFFKGFLDQTANQFISAISIFLCKKEKRKEQQSEREVKWG